MGSGGATCEAILQPRRLWTGNIPNFAPSYNTLFTLSQNAWCCSWDDDNSDMVTWCLKPYTPWKLEVTMRRSYCLPSRYQNHTSKKNHGRTELLNGARSCYDSGYMFKPKPFWGRRTLPENLPNTFYLQWVLQNNISELIRLCIRSSVQHYSLNVGCSLGRASASRQ